jgi:hypothetical protein
VARKSEVSAGVGENAELECVAHGNPQPLISWQRRDGAQIQVGIELNIEKGQIMVKLRLG